MGKRCLNRQHTLAWRVLVRILSACLLATLGSPCLAVQGESVSPSSELARVPFLRHMNLVIVKASIDGNEPVSLLLDTGAGSGLVLDSELADQYDLKMSKPRKGGKTSQGGQFSMRFAPKVSLGVGGHEVEIKNALVARCLGQAQTMLGIDVHGIIGHHFFNQVTVEVDYESHELVLHDPEKFEYEGEGAILDLEFDPNVSNLPFTHAVFESENGEQHRIRMLVDSGGSTSTTGGLGLQADVQAVVPAGSPRVPIKGVSGLADSSEETMHSSFMTRLHRMNLGPYSLERPIVNCGQTHKFNLFGGEVLRRFDVVFDYRRKRMILKPNASFKAPLEVDQSGMMIVAADQNLDMRLIQFVTPDSPAANAGLKSGDEILSIDGAAAAKNSLQATREIFFEAGRKHTLQVKRGDEILSFIVETKELF